MGIDGYANTSEDLKEKGERRQVARILNFNADALQESKAKSDTEQFGNGALDGADDPSISVSNESTYEPFGASSSDEEDNRVKNSAAMEEQTSSQQSDVGSVHPVNNHLKNYVKHSATLEVSRDWSISPSRHPRRG